MAVVATLAATSRSTLTPIPLKRARVRVRATQDAVHADPTDVRHAYGMPLRRLAEALSCLVFLNRMAQGPELFHPTHEMKYGMSGV
jgi:hypothetical protein